MGERSEDPELLIRLLDRAPAAVVLVDAETTIRWVNAPAADLFGYSIDEAVGRSVLEFLDPDWDPEAFESIGTAMGGQGLRQPMLFRVLRGDGSKAIVEVTANSQMDDPVLGGMVAYVRPWGERWLLDQALEAMAASRPLAETLRLLVAVAEAETLTADAALLHGWHDGRFSAAEASAGLPPALVGPTLDQPPAVVEAWAPIVAAPVGAVHAVDDLPPVLATPASAAGYRTLWVWPSSAHGGVAPAVTAVAWRREDHLDVDQTRRQAMARLARVAGLVVERVRTEEATAHAADHDALTGLANRKRFYEVLDERLAAPGTTVGVAYLDLDAFKPVNDALGHGVGDQVLVEVGRRVAAVVPTGALAARLGGDEFAVLCEGGDAAVVEDLARAVIEALDAPVDLGPSGPVRVGASAGVARAEGGTVDADALVEAADAALYEAKRAGGGVVRVA